MAILHAARRLSCGHGARRGSTVQPQNHTTNGSGDLAVVTPLCGVSAPPRWDGQALPAAAASPWRRLRRTANGGRVGGFSCW
jgi:hypothetical protein